MMLALVSIVVCSCSSTALQRATSTDTEEAFRAFLSEYPESEEAAEARSRLEQHAFQRARRGDDIAAYNRFLNEFPEGDFAREARERRAELRLDRALATGDAEALRRFIALDSGTRAASRALEQLERLEAGEVRESDDPSALRDFLLAYPESDERQAIERRLDDIEFSRASEVGTLETLRGYMEAHEHGIHRAEALEALEALEADRAIASGRIEDLEAYLQAHPGSSREAEVRRAAAAAIVERAEDLLDVDLARRVIDLDPDGPSAPRAEALLDRVRRGGARVTKVRGLLADLVDPMALRDPDELREALRSDDPRARWSAVREIALATDTAAIDVAVEAAGSGDPMLLYLSRAALASWTDTKRQQAEAPLRSWLGRLRKRSSNPEDLLRIGAVSEALGEHDAALQAYRTAARQPPTALAASVQWAQLAATQGTRRDQDQAIQRLLETSRARLEELLAMVPDQLTSEQHVSALQLVGGLESLERLCQAVIASYRLTPPDGVGSEGDAVGLEALSGSSSDDLQRVITAAAAARRRLEARLARDAPELVDDDESSLTRRATERRRRRVEAAEALGAMRATEAVPALLGVASIDDGQVGRAALAALERIGSAEARAGLVELSRAPHLRGVQAPDLLRVLRALRSRAARAADRGALDEAIGALEARPENEHSGNEE